MATLHASTSPLGRSGSINLAQRLAKLLLLRQAVVAVLVVGRLIPVDGIEGCGVHDNDSFPVLDYGDLFVVMKTSIRSYSYRLAGGPRADGSISQPRHVDRLANVGCKMLGVGGQFLIAIVVIGHNNRRSLAKLATDGSMQFESTHVRQLRVDQPQVANTAHHVSRRGVSRSQEMEVPILSFFRTQQVGVVADVGIDDDYVSPASFVCFS